MYISTKSNVIQSIDDVEWQCRRKSKGMTKSEYWAWETTITKDGVVTYPDEDFTIFNCTDENVNLRLAQLSEYISDDIYNIKYYTTKKNGSHFVGDDTAKDARILADKWENIRIKRDSKLSETDYLALSDNTLSADMKKYRQGLRDVPTQSDPDNITWPTKP